MLGFSIGIRVVDKICTAIEQKDRPGSFLIQACQCRIHVYLQTTARRKVPVRI